MKKRNILIILIILPAIICMYGIFYFSSQDNVSTNTLSKNITQKIAEIVFQNYNTFSADVQNLITNELNLFIRKAAHFSLYFLIGLFFSIFFIVLKRKFLVSGIISVTVCCIYAMLDEFHQSFVPGRTPLVKDVLIDTSGAILGTVSGFMITASVFYIAKYRRHEK